MIRKKDLVKQFELVVRQEIIEHNKTISATNLRFNELRTNVLELREELSKEINKLGCEDIRLSHDQEGLFYTFKKMKEDFLKLVSDNERFNKRNFKEIQIIDESIETVHRNQQNLKGFFDCLSDQFDKMKKAIDELSKLHEYERQRLKYGFIKDINKAKNEILSKPSEAIPLRKEFMEELSMHKIDNEGLLKEIKVLKKTAFIIEKKIENLYTLIERLNKKLT